MKRNLILIALAFVTAVSFGQKKELKKAERSMRSGDVSAAMAAVNEAEGLVSGADNDTKAHFYTVKAEVYLADAGKSDFNKLKQAGDALMKAGEFDQSGKMSERRSIGAQNLRVALVNSAVDDQNRKNNRGAAEKLYLSYKVAKDTTDLYFAAGNSVNAGDYALALDYYQTLLDMGYTGIRKEYIATELETNKTVSFPTVEDRNTNMLTGKYTNPDERMSESVRGEILRNVTLIHISQGNNEKAMEVMKAARAENPDDMGLVRAEADMAYKMGDMTRYNELMEQVVASDPDNPELYYNLGVGSAKNGDDEKASEYYKKALELDPNYVNAKINLAALILSKEGPIIEEMNSLGTSNADYKRYDELKEIKNDLYREAIPYLDSAMELNPENIEIVRTLMNIYGQLGDDDKFKAMKAKLEAMEGGN